MKAFVKESDSSSGIQFMNMPVPEISEDELLIKVQAIGVGVHDEYFLPPGISYPFVVGIEAAGEVEKVGSGVAEYKVGQRLAFISIMQTKGGTWAEYAAVSKNSLILPIPENMNFEQAAALLVAGNTALKALSIAGLEPGGTLFIAGGAGAIGTLLIQLAATRGYKVAASASEKNHKYMKSLGADLTVDYHDLDWQQRVKKWQPKGVDAAIGIHPGTPAESQTVVKDDGTVVAISGDQFAPERSIVLQQVNSAKEVKAELVEMFNLVATNKVQLPIEKVYPFADAVQALEKVKTRHVKGKLVIAHLQE